LPWAALLREAAEDWGGFPHLGLFGTQGGGKTSLGRLLWRLCGVPPKYEPLSLATTPFARMRTLACTNLVPVWIDEFRPSGWSDADVRALAHELRAAYGGETVQRGLSNLSVRAYGLCAPVLLSGEDWPADTALRERLLAVTPNPEDLKGRDGGFVQAFREVHRAPLEAFAVAYWVWAVGQDDWRQEVEAARRRVEALLERAGRQLPLRTVNNLAIAAFGIDMLSRFLGRSRFGWEDGDVEGALLQQAQTLFPEGDRRLPLDDLLLLAASQAHTTLTYGHHWVLAAGRVVLRLDAVVADLRKFAQQSGHPTEIFGLDTYRRPPRSCVMRATPMSLRPRPARSSRWALCAGCCSIRRSWSARSASPRTYGAAQRPGKSKCPAAKVNNRGIGKKRRSVSAFISPFDK
jgi:hypothetical protein